jgi:hypothetical protein
MSKGLGRIELGILEAFRAEPDEAFTTDELAQRIYRIDTVEKKHRVAILRAGHTLNPALNNFSDLGKKEYNWLKAAKMDCGDQRLFVFFNCCNLRSYGMSHAKTAYYPIRYDKAYFRKWFGERMAVGGAWWMHVEEYKIKCSGDLNSKQLKKLKQLKAANEKASAKHTAALVAAMKKARGR